MKNILVSVLLLICFLNFWCKEEHEEVLDEQLVFEEPEWSDWEDTEDRFDFCCCDHDE